MKCSHSLSLHFTSTIINVESPVESQMTGTVRMRLCNGWIETEKESPSWSGGQYLPAAIQINVLGRYSSRAALLEVRRHPSIITIHHNNSLFPTPQSTLHPVPCAPVRTGQTQGWFEIMSPYMVSPPRHPPPSPLVLPEPSVLLHCQFSVLAGFQQDSHRDR